MTKFLVTGVAGFIGSTIARRLLDEGADVVGIDSMSDYYDVGMKARNLSGIRGIDFVYGDITNFDLSTLVSDVEYVLHQAGQPGVRKSWGRDFDLYTQQNIVATQLLLEACRDAPRLRRFVYASSSSVYGDAETFPTREDALPAPRSPYGVSKLAAEHLCGVYARNFGVPTVSLRYFTVFGPRQRPDMAFTRFSCAAARGSTIGVYGDGSQIRDFTYVDDVVDANLRAALSEGVVSGSVLNISGGASTSVNEVLGVLERLAGVPLHVAYLDAVAGDVFRTAGDASAAQRVLGWRPKVTLEEGLARQFAWAREEISLSGS